MIVTIIYSDSTNTTFENIDKIYKVKFNPYEKCEINFVEETLIQGNIYQLIGKNTNTTVNLIEEHVRSISIEF